MKPPSGIANMTVVGHQVPRRKTRVLSVMGKLILELTGWRFENELPNIPKCVVIFAPHTSNWDFVFGMAIIFGLQIEVEWIGKHTLFRKPLGSIARWIGGIPIDRRSSQGMIERMVKRLKTRDKFFLAIAPEGTRKKTRRWKSGFYYIALGANAPILMVCFDYPDKVISFSQLMHPTGDYDADVEELQLTVAGIRGKNS